MTILCPLAHAEPRETKPPRNICEAHAALLRANLQNLAKTLVHLGDLYTAKPFGDDHNELRMIRQDPPAPLNLAVVDLTDVRSDTPALPRLDGWVRLIGEERRLSWVPVAPHRQAEFVLTHFEWLLGHEAAGVAFDELNLCWQWVRHVAGLGGSSPIFVCPVVLPGAEGGCGGPVFQRYERSMLVRCARCGSEWDGELELRRAGLMLGSSAAAAG